jgi:short subunit dehydrogenase-like uncharacterized protein
MTPGGELLIYGTGYSAGLTIEAALALGLRPILGGRDPGRLEALADRFQLERRVASLTDADSLAAALRDVRVVLHCAGPFVETAAPMVAACLDHGVHYLDLTGEARAVEQVAGRHAEARRRGVMLMPAVGFETMPTDCLAAHVMRRLPRARSLAIASTLSPFVTRGSARTLLAMGDASLARRSGALVRVPAGGLVRDFDFGRGLTRTISCGLADVVTAWYTTGVPDITGYVEAPPRLQAAIAAWQLGSPLRQLAPVQAWLHAWIAMLPDGPTTPERLAHRMTVVAEATAGSRRVLSRLTTPEAYTTTGLAAAAVALRVVAGDAEPGFQTPARLWGSDLVLALPDVERVDVA